MPRSNWHMLLAAVVMLVTVVAGDPITRETSQAADAKKPAAKKARAPKAATKTVSFDALDVARRVDELINKQLDAAGAKPAELAGDEDFLRRVTFDLVGTTPSPEDVTLFGLDPDANKRTQLIDRLLETDEYATNWARYWRDVIFSRATDPRSRIAQGTFEEWLAAELKQNHGWNDVATELLTATGDVLENGDTALMFAHQGDAAEIASETSRIFLGIQIQCANCHDHPTDSWKREQFHQLAAFFPRVRLRPKQDATPRSFEVVSFDMERRGGPAGRDIEPKEIFNRLDRNRDDKLTKAEAKNAPRLKDRFDQILKYADADEDGALTLKEMENMQRPDNDRRGTTEYFMPDLNDPASDGTRIDPIFFVSGSQPAKELADVERRETLAKYITSPENPWFAKAYVNRIWSEMLGEGFYMPIDDMGPEREPAYPEVLDLLCAEFTSHSYDVKWLFRTIANTEAYQRQVQSRDAADESPPFAAASPTRLRSDQLFNAILKVLGAEESAGRREEAMAEMGMYARLRSPRSQFAELFNFDPSTPQADITGEIPQALFMMNSPVLAAQIRGIGRTKLAEILRTNDDDKAAVQELYLLVLAREPSENELKIALDYRKEIKNRQEAFEDLMWSLMNSSEFLSRR